MNELPNELQALLNLTRDAHDPTDPDARTRVRSAIAASLLMAGTAASSAGALPQAAASNTQLLAGSAKAGKASWLLFGSKLATIAASTVAAAGLTWAVYGYGAQPTQVASVPRAAPIAVQQAALPAPSVQAPAPAPSMEPPSVAAMPAPANVDDSPDNATTVDKAKPRKARGAETLSAEMALLRGASEALARGDEQAALVQLREHGRRYPDGSLREERDGLRAIAECNRDDHASSVSAKRFLRSYPSSLLATRVRKACVEE